MKRTPLRRTRIRSLAPGEDPPPGEPKRYQDPRGYIRLRWKVGSAQYVETYEHRLAAGLPVEAVVVHPRPPRDPNRFGGYRSQEAMEKAQRAKRRREEALRRRVEIGRLYESGKTTLEIGAALGIDPSNVSRALKAIGVPGRTSYAAPLDAAEVVRLYIEELLTPSDIGRRMHAHEERVRRVLREHGVMRRSGRPARPGPPSYAQEFEKARLVAIDRARGGCEVGIDGCLGAASHVHHRKMRSQGGGNELDNLLAVCRSCHREIHRAPAVAYSQGWLVRSVDDPAVVPVDRDRGAREWLRRSYHVDVPAVYAAGRDGD